MPQILFHAFLHAFTQHHIVALKTFCLLDETRYEIRNNRAAERFKTGICDNILADSFFSVISAIKSTYVNGVITSY